MEDKARFITINLYSLGVNGIKAGKVSADDAACIHGTVSFALTRNTVFVVTSAGRRVAVEIGAGDDKRDFESSTIPNFENAAVTTVDGPKHNNLTSAIRIRFRGAGKRIIVSKNCDPPAL